MQTIKKLFAQLCAAAFLAGCLCLSVLADSGTDAFSEAAAEPMVITCTEVPLYSDIDDRYIGTGFVMNSITYVPLLTFTEYALGKRCQVRWDQASGTATILADNLYISVTMNLPYMVANDRYIYLEDGAYNINGTILVPVRELARVFSLDLKWDDEEWAVRINTEGAKIFASGAEYYNADDLYWLSRVIYSEAGNQPIEGMIGVGNVVLNRAGEDSARFADTIKGVIFQEGQFDVVPSGAIYLDPNERSVVAAKLCLEGYNTVGDSKWFMNPRIGATDWFESNATLVAAIADHNFYG